MSAAKARRYLLCNQILPGTGRWQAEGLTEGGFGKGRTLPHAPATMLRMVPLPVQGRN